MMRTRREFIRTGIAASALVASPDFVRNVPPLRESRVGDYRVFYDVNESAAIVMVRAVRPKPADKRMEDIL